MTTVYPHVFKFSDHTQDPRLLKYDAVLQYLYHKILTDARAPVDASAKQLADIIGRTKKEAIKRLIELSDKYRNMASKAHLVFYLLRKQYGRLYDFQQGWPPSDYPDVKYDEEDAAELPPICKIPSRLDESMMEFEIRIIRNILDDTKNPLLKNKNIHDAITILYLIKQILNRNEDTTNDRNEINISRNFDSQPELDSNNVIIPYINTILALLRELDEYKATYRINMYELFFIIALNDIKYKSARDYGRMVKRDMMYGTTYLMDDPSIIRFYGSIEATLLDILNRYIYSKSYNEFDANPLHGQLSVYTQKCKNRNQQVFICIPIDTSLESVRIFTPSYAPPDQPHISVTSVAATEFAWIKFNYTFPPLTITVDREYDPEDPTMPLRNGKQYTILRNIVQFQGYRLMDMPPPPILKAFAHGPPVDMASHVRTLFPEWTRPDTCAAWLDKVMAKWLSDIRLLTLKLQQTICTGDAPNEQAWHLRDVPTIQMDLFNDVLAYIAEQRGIPVADLRQQIVDKGEAEYMTRLRQSYLKGGRRKTAAKSKGMVRARKTHRQQRGGSATGMPLAYYQDGAQMRGTYAEPTGVGLAGSNGSMARVGISQTGGKQNSQKGGFAPSIMGTFVQNGAYLAPIASFMSYKMLKGRPTGRTSRAHRGPRSTQKKRRASRRR